MRGPTAYGSSARVGGLAGRLVLVLAGLCLLLLAALATSASAANTYSVSVCTKTANDGITTGEDPGGSMELEALNLCGEAPGVGDIAHATTQPTGISGGTFWKLTAPQGTVIQELDLSREIGPRPDWNTGFEWSLTAGNGNVLADVLGAPLPADGPAHFTVNASSVTADLRCRFTAMTCSLAPGPGEAVQVNVSNMVATIRDEIPPTVGFSPNLPPTVRGTIEVPYSAHDIGSGVARAHFFVDGSLRTSVSDTNGGRCVAAAALYRFLVPCKTSIAGSFPLDTTQLKEGTHMVQVLVADASGQFGETAVVPIRVHNAPTNTQRPTIGGKATLGATLTAGDGQWEGSPTSFALQWLRCPAAVALGAETGCTAIPGATAARYVPATQDLGQREVVRVTATNAFGSDSALSAPTAVVARPDTTAPVLSRVSLSRGRLTAGGRRAVLRFSSSEAASLSVAISRARRGAKPVLTLSRTIPAGPGHLRLGGRIGGHTLRPGHYRLSLVARDDAGNASRPVRLSFWVLPGPG
jgi:hypothetical protein